MQKTNNIFLSSITFYLGLCLVFTFNLNLFTGKVLTLRLYQLTLTIKEYILKLIQIWLGNLIGSVITSILLCQIKYLDVSTLITNKLNMTPIQMIISGIACNMLVCSAIYNYRIDKNHMISCFIIMIFVICGFSHIVADFSYYTIAILNGINIDVISIIKSLVFVTIGNVLGGLLVYKIS